MLVLPKAESAIAKNKLEGFPSQNLVYRSQEEVLVPYAPSEITLLRRAGIDRSQDRAHVILIQEQRRPSDDL